MSQEGKEENRLEYIQLSHRPPKHTENKNHGEGEKRRDPEHRGHGKAAMRLRKQRRNRIIGISCLSVIILLLVICIAVKFFHKDSADVDGTPAASSNGEGNESIKAPETAKLSETDFQFTMTADKQEAGTALEKKEIADYEGYAVRYPSMGIQVMDEAIAQRVDDIVSVFKAEVEGCRTDEPVRMTMLTDYESYQTEEELISVKFNIHTELPMESLSGDSIETYTYDLAGGAEITLADVLKEGYLDMLAEKTKAFAESQNGTLIETAVAADALNFRYYTWNEDGLTLYFPGGTLVEGVDEILSCTIPMEDLKDYLTRDLAGGSETVQGQVSVPGNVDPTKPMVCLTFDDGPSAATTPELLDILEENDARATFFVVGSMLQKNDSEEIIKRALDLGCQVGNHTMSHENFKSISDEEIHQQIEGVNDILEGWGLERCSTVRPPYGGWNNHVLTQVDYPMARWDVDTLDWETRDAASTINNVLYDEKLKAEDGDIILMHDIHAETIEACRTIIPELKARGFQLVTMEEMFAAKGIPYEAGKVYYSSGCIKTDFGS